MTGHECYHCKQWVESGEAHDCWTTTEAVLTRLLRPGGTFYFSTTAVGNPFRWPLEYLMEWQLIERDEAAVRALLPGCDVSVGREPTGLALLTHVRVRRG